MRGLRWFVSWLVLASCACKAASSDGPKPGSGAKSESVAAVNAGDASVSGLDAGAARGSSDSSAGPGRTTRASDAGAPVPSTGMRASDAGSRTDATAMMDAGGMNRMTPSADKPDASPITMLDAAPASDAQMGTLGMGSCCSEHDTAGCSNADLQVCVCEKLPACCTKAWDTACVLIVKQKYCQQGVRDCVCGDASGQWGQHTCCDSNWSENFCNQVAQNKCGAAPGCL
jgi:hypothetical protein